VGAINKVISTEAAKLGVLSEEAYKEKNMFGKMFARMKANLNISEVENKAGTIVAKESNLLSKGMKAGGAAAGAVLVGYGLKDLGQSVGFVSPDVDEQGKEVPADSGKLVKSVAELGAGAALAYFTLLHGGKVNAAHI
jgi:hypothetical protein